MAARRSACVAIAFVVTFLAAVTIVGSHLGAKPLQAANITVDAVDDFFIPASITVSVADTVTWRNVGRNLHTSTSDTGVWASPNLFPGSTFSFTFTSPGVFPYHCVFHLPGMVGTITVSGASPTTVPTFTAVPTSTSTYTPVPTSTPTATALPGATATVAPTAAGSSPTPTSPTVVSGAGGRGFTLIMGGGRTVSFSWQPGSQQASYTLDRFTASGLQQLPVPGGAGATRASDEVPAADLFACYQVHARSATGAVLFNSDFFCAILGILQGIGPSGLSVRLDQSNTATVSWNPAPGATSYSVLELITGRTQLLGGNVASTTDGSGGNVVCYLVLTDGGRSDVACAVPGFSG